MFNSITNTAIDAVQTSKKHIVATFVKHENLADTINKFVDIETSYTKALFDNTNKTLSDMYSIFTNKNFISEIKESFNIPPVFDYANNVKAKASKKAQ
jgi:hypothetical protein